MKNILEELKNFRLEMANAGFFNAMDLKNRMESVFESEGYRQKNSDNIENILIVHDAGVGDFINLSPAIKALRNKFPKSRVTLICESKTYFLARSCPYVDSIFLNSKCYDWEEFIPMFDWQLELVEKIPAVKFDIAFCFCHRIGSILLAYMLGSKTIVHYNSTAICSPNNFELRIVVPLINRYIKTNFSKPHIVDRYLCMLDGFFEQPIEDRELEIWYEPKSMDTAKKIFVEHGLIGKIVFALSMGGSSLDKHYPPEKYAELARRISERVPNAVFVNIGGSSDIESAEKFSNAFNDSERFINLVNRLNYAETAALISLCDCYIGNDTSAVHISAAMKIPCLQPNCFPMDHELKFDSSPLMYYPYRVPSISVMPIRSLPECVESEKFRGCGIETEPHCITQISVDSMLAGFDMLLKKIQKHDSTPNFIY